MTIEEKLKIALEEVLGFVRRNDERAEKAAEAAKQQLDIQKMATATYKQLMQDHLQCARAMIETEARYHEAHRIYLVIRERVEEALK